MPDFDVQALSLASPPSAAPVTTYRPAVRVRNNGVIVADVAGYLRIYRREPPGELLATHQLSLLNLGAGLEGDALSSGYWTPTAADVGREFLFTAHIDTDRDQNTGNNDLSPITVIVTAGEPPPPPSVLAHATQHESGGADQVEITGLHGLAADAQTALAHKATHQAGGPDAMNVSGLLGVLAEGQPIADHHEEHEDGGGDELNVAGLRGELTDNQPAKVHDNAKHDPNYTTVTEHNTHLTDTTAVHAVATNLEQIANKGEANGYAGLAANGYVPVDQLAPIPQIASNLTFLRRDTSWSPLPCTIADAISSAVHILDDTETILLEHSGPGGDSDGTLFEAKVGVLITSSTNPAILLISLMAGDSIATLTTVAWGIFPINAAPVLSVYAIAHLCFQLLDGEANGGGIAFSNAGGASTVILPATGVSECPDNTYVRVKAKLNVNGTHIHVLNASLSKSTR